MAKGLQKICKQSCTKLLGVNHRFSWRRDPVRISLQCHFTTQNLEILWTPCLEFSLCNCLASSKRFQMLSCIPVQIWNGEYEACKDRYNLKSITAMLGFQDFVESRKICFLQTIGIRTSKQGGGQTFDGNISKLFWKLNWWACLPRRWCNMTIEMQFDPISGKLS